MIQPDQMALVAGIHHHISRTIIWMSFHVPGTVRASDGAIVVLRIQRPTCFRFAVDSAGSTLTNDFTEVLVLQQHSITGAAVQSRMFFDLPLLQYAITGRAADVEGSIARRNAVGGQRIIRGEDKRSAVFALQILTTTDRDRGATALVASKVSVLSNHLARSIQIQNPWSAVRRLDFQVIGQTLAAGFAGVFIRG